MENKKLDYRTRSPFRETAKLYKNVSKGYRHKFLSDSSLFYKLVFRLRNIPFLTWVSKLHRAGVEGRNFPIFKSEGRPLILYPKDPGQCLCDAITGQH